MYQVSTTTGSHCVPAQLATPILQHCTPTPGDPTPSKYSLAPKVTANCCFTANSRQTQYFFVGVKIEIVEPNNLQTMQASN